MKRKLLLELCISGVYEGERILRLGNWVFWVCNLKKKKRVPYWDVVFKSQQILRYFEPPASHPWLLLKPLTLWTLARTLSLCPESNQNIFLKAVKAILQLPLLLLEICKRTRPLLPWKCKNWSKVGLFQSIICIPKAAEAKISALYVPKPSQLASLKCEFSLTGAWQNKYEVNKKIKKKEEK